MRALGLLGRHPRFLALLLPAAGSAQAAEALCARMEAALRRVIASVDHAVKVCTCTHKHTHTRTHTRERERERERETERERES